MSINISSQVYSIPYLYTMSQAEYRKLQKRSDGETLLVTIPTGLKDKTLDGKRVILEKV